MKRRDDEGETFPFHEISVDEKDQIKFFPSHHLPLNIWSESFLFNKTDEFSTSLFPILVIIETVWSSYVSTWDIPLHNQNCILVLNA